MNDIDCEQIVLYLDTAAMFSERQNDFAVGLWLGRALEAASQNAVDRDWLKAAFAERDLDTALVEMSRSLARPQG